MPRGRPVINAGRAAGAGTASPRNAPSGVMRSPRRRSLARQCLLPVAQEVEPLLLVEPLRDLRTHGDGFHVVAEVLVELGGRVLGVDVVADREKLDVAADQLLPALRQ